MVDACDSVPHIPAPRVLRVHDRQRVNTLRDFHWYDVVAVEQVLARLALDARSAAIAPAATQLLMRSYFPAGVRGAEQYRRTLKFLQTAPAAALAFYGHVHAHASVAHVTKLVLILHKGTRMSLSKLQRAAPAEEGASRVKAGASAKARPGSVAKSRGTKRPQRERDGSDSDDEDENVNRGNIVDDAACSDVDSDVDASCSSAATRSVDVVLLSRVLQVRHPACEFCCAVT